jgi:ADP-ribose pyrophosphatase
MESFARLPAPPKVELEIVGDRVNATPFLDVRRVELVAVRDGERSDPFPYDILERRALDACIMVAHHVRDGAVHVYLRSAVRPPVALRPIAPSASGLLWEVPAGLVEPGESPVAAAVRELDEELGFTVRPEDLVPLGPWSVPAPGFIGEIHHTFHVRVDPTTQRTPGGDGSPLERDARILSIPLAAALDACRRGDVRDAKTELALRRLAEMLVEAK